MSLQDDLKIQKCQAKPKVVTIQKKAPWWVIIEQAAP